MSDSESYESEADSECEKGNYLKCGPDSEYIEVPFNVCYGGFNFSDHFIREYERRCRSREIEPQDIAFASTAEQRTDPIILELLNEKGTSWACDSYCSMYLYPVPKKYIECVHISDYDGQESIQFLSNNAYTGMIEGFLKRSEEDHSLTLDDLKKEVTEFKEMLERYIRFKREVYHC